MSEEAVPVTEEGRSWTIDVCLDCGFRDNARDYDGERCPACRGSRLGPVEVVESSKLRAVEAELGRLDDALREIRSELSHGLTANLEYVSKRIDEALNGGRGGGRDGD